MSAKLFGFDSSTFIPAPDFQASQNEESLWEGSQSFSISREAFDFFTGSANLLVGQPATVLDPNLADFFSFLRLTRIEAEHVTGGFARVRVFYAGYFSINQSQDPDSAIPAAYNLSGTLEEVPLMEHPKIEDLSDEERQYLNYIVEGVAAWDVGTSKLGTLQVESGGGNPAGTFVPFPGEGQKIVSSDGIAFADLLAKGETTYKRPSFQWTKTYTSEEEIPTAAINDLGKISTPDGDPPQPAGSRNWMLVSADQTQTASTAPVYDIQLSWLLSDRDGWNSTLYDD